MPDEKTKKALESFRKQSVAYIKTLPDEPKKKKESRLRRLKRILKMIALGEKYGRPKTRRKVGGVYAGYARRTVAPKTK